MTISRTHLALALFLLAVTALNGCRREQADPGVSLMANESPGDALPEPPSTLADPELEIPFVRLTHLELGTAVGSDQRIVAHADTFQAGDPIIAAVSAMTSRPDARILGDVVVQWWAQDGRRVGHEQRSVEFAGKSALDFQLDVPQALPSGRYRIDIALDDKLLRSRSFEVK